MATKILITGGTGLVGRALSELLSKNYEVSHLSRQRQTGPYKTYLWDVENGYIDHEALNTNYVIHLAGENIAEGRWTEKRKQSLLDSRIKSARLLIDAIVKQGVRLEGFISASAIGYYGADSGDRLVTETDDQGNDFLGSLVGEWEKEVSRISDCTAMLTKLRIGVVLAQAGGALPKLTLPVKLGVGAPLGSGKQFVSWIHQDDFCRMVKFVIDQKIKGTFNAVANSCTNREMTNYIAKIVRRPLWLPNVPGWVLKVMLGEMSSIILGGNNVDGSKICKMGFRFKYREIEPALASLLKKEQ